MAKNTATAVQVTRKSSAMVTFKATKVEKFASAPGFPTLSVYQVEGNEKQFFAVAEGGKKNEFVVGRNEARTFAKAVRKFWAPVARVNEAAERADAKAARLDVREERAQARAEAKEQRTADRAERAEARTAAREERAEARAAKKAARAEARAEKASARAEAKASKAKPAKAKTAKAKKVAAAVKEVKAARKPTQAKKAEKEMLKVVSKAKRGLVDLEWPEA